MPTAYPGALAAPKRGWRGLSALLASLLAALLVVTGMSAAPAMAAPTGTVQIEFPQGDNNPTGGAPVFEEGKSYTMTVSYDNRVVPGGHEVTIAVPKGFTIGQAPAENTAIESFTLENGELKIKFKDPIPVAQGAFNVEFQVDKLEKSSQEEIKWGIKGAEESKTVVIKNKEDEFINFSRDASRKDAYGVQWPGVEVVDGKVVLSDDFLKTEIPFAVTVWNKTARSLTITDTLGENLTFVPGSFTMSKTVWGADGMNKEGPTNVAVQQFEGTSFTLAEDAPANSIYTLNYKAKIADQAGLENVRKLLQDQYNGVKDQFEADFGIALTNSVTVNEEQHGTETWIAGRTPKEPKPEVGKAFSKGNNLPWNTPVELNADNETLTKPLAVEYTLNADLTQFDGFEGTKYELNRDVIMTDTLPAQLRWLDADKFITVDNMKLTRVENISAADFAAQSKPGMYMVDGQKLLVNVGKDTKKHYIFKVKAELFTVDGLTETANPADNKYAAIQFSRITNRADWLYATDSDGNDVSKKTTTDHQLFIAKDAGSEIDDDQKFSKRAEQDKIELKKGEDIAWVPFKFSVGKNVGNALTSSIVDEIDHETLNVTNENLGEIKQSITGAYGNTKLTGEMFDLSLDGENLVFTPNKNFPTDNGSKEARGAFTFTVKLPTHKIEGNTAVTVKNSASYSGSDIEYVYSSETKSKAGVEGREMDLTKTVYDAKTKSFTTNLRVKVNDATGDLEQSEFIYRIQLLPTMNFDKILFNVDDVLDGKMEFAGFVDPADIESGKVVDGDTYVIPGSSVRVELKKNAEGAEQLQIAKGQKVSGGDVTELFFKVKIKDFSYGEGIENTVNNKKATITPTNDFPLDISKIDAVNPNGEPITDRNASFELLDADGKVVLQNMYVVGGKLRLAGDNGKDLVPTVKSSGEYTVREVKAPAGYVKTDKTITVTVDKNGASKEAKFFNTPRSAVKKVSVGDYVWIDTDRDGIQDPGTDIPLKDVLMSVTGPDGKPVKNIDGDLVADRYTDENGFYEFTDLPALAAGEHYTVSIVQKDEQTTKSLHGLTPTQEHAGDDREKDSSTWVAESIDLVNDGDKDYSLDFGFIRKSVSVGDYVWLDVDRDGIQGTSPDEKPIPGVKLVLTGPDGKPVVDINGNEVAPVWTDDNGFYEFTNLPALAQGESYTVKIDREDDRTKEALQGLTPTKDRAGDDREKDSSTWVAKSTDLVNDGDKDYSLDFGFQVKSYAVGDLVWIDSNKDGLQSDNEIVLSDVTVRLFEEIVNAEGEVEAVLVAETKTDRNGLYKFDDLTAGKYRVQFELTAEQAENYEFTKYSAGKHHRDSNAGEDGFSDWFMLDDTNTDLTTSYEYADLVGGITATQGIDPTWDAGVIELKMFPSEPITGAEGTGGTTGKKDGPTIGGLVSTGGMGLWGYVAGGIAMLLLGAAGLILSRRRAARNA